MEVVVAMPEFDDPRIQAIFEAGQRRVNEMLAELPADGTIPLPFRCYLCDQRRMDYFMRTGEGLPICRRCFESCAGSPVPVNWNPEG